MLCGFWNHYMSILKLFNDPVSILFLAWFQGVLRAIWVGLLTSWGPFWQITSVNWFFCQKQYLIHVLSCASISFVHLTLLLVFLFWKCAYGSTLKQKTKISEFPTSLIELKSLHRHKSIDPLYSVNVIGMTFWSIYTSPVFSCYFYSSRSLCATEAFQ